MLVPGLNYNFETLVECISEMGVADQIRWAARGQVSFVTCHASCVTCHVSCVMCHVSCVMCDVPRVTCVST